MPEKSNLKTTLKVWRLCPEHKQIGDIALVATIFYIQAMATYEKVDFAPN